MIRKLILAAVMCFGGLLLAACTTTQNADAIIQKNLPKICSTAANAHSAFVIVASTGNVKASTVKKEAAAFAALRAVCDNPGSFTVDTALVRAAEAYAIMVVALREAKST